ncbi:hypothetical protein B566_EDAN016645 [Ephemera danica]|nr:hypothetical protein B566_EDAN016645 [Ephemera danica]
MFSSVEVNLNNKLVTPVNNTAANRAYIEMLLNYSSDVKANQMMQKSFTLILLMHSTRVVTPTKDKKTEGIVCSQQRGRCYRVFEKFHPSPCCGECCQDHIGVCEIDVALDRVLVAHVHCVFADGDDTSYFEC